MNKKRRKSNTRIDETGKKAGAKLKTNAAGSGFGEGTSVR